MKADTLMSLAEMMKLSREELRQALAAYFLANMLGSGGSKEDKVRAAFEYADLILKG